MLAIGPGAVALARPMRLDGRLFPCPVPMLALGLDATALLALEQMANVVPAVKYDRPVRLQ